MAHDSIKLLLDRIERDYKKRPTHSELARALNVSEQVITNWAKRGISVEGALAAQFAFHMDANFILGRLPHPMLCPRQGENSAPLQVNQTQLAYFVAPSGGPSEAELLKHFRKLDDSGKTQAISFVKVFAAGNQSQDDGQALHMAG